MFRSLGSEALFCDFENRLVIDEKRIIAGGGDPLHPPLAFSEPYRVGARIRFGLVCRFGPQLLPPGHPDYSHASVEENTPTCALKRSGASREIRITELACCSKQQGSLPFRCDFAKNSVEFALVAFGVAQAFVGRG